MAAFSDREQPFHPRFSVERRLGAGGFGVVYVAFDNERQERVALKQLRRMSRSALDRFKREFRELSRLTHRNLPLLYELFCQGDDWFFTMELLDGVSLRRYVTGREEDHGESIVVPTSTALTDFASEALPVAGDAQQPRVAPAYDERRLRHALTQLLDVVGFLHQQNYVHGDLKPSNVLVARDERLYLLDFGLVGRQDERRTDVAGTMAYAPPELLESGPMERSHDAYALGSMFFELCAGRPPFWGDGLRLLLEKARRPAPPIASVAPGTPDDLARRIDGWLAQDPAQRLGLGDSTPTPTLARAPFVGRSKELATLQDALARVTATGRCEVMRIEGRSGFGKTALLEAFVRGAAPTALTLTSRASAKEHVPFNAFDGLLDALAPLTSTGGRTELAAAIKDRVRALAGGRPTVLWLDDVQWADADSAAILEELVQPPRLRSCLIVLSTRPNEPGYTVLRLPCPVTPMALGPLGDEDARTLARSLGVEGDQLASVVARASGMALFLEALCAADDREYSDAPALIKAEVERLSPLDRTLVDGLSLSQSPLPAASLMALFDEPPVELGRSLEKLCRRRLLRPVQRHDLSGYAPFHDQVRETVMTLMSPRAAQRYHERLLAVLPEEDARLLPARFEHLRGARRRHEAAALALRAAEAAEAAMAYEQAAFHLEQALALGAVVGEARERLLEQLIGDLERAKLGPRAAEVALELSRTAQRREKRLAATIRAVRHFLACGEIDRGRALLAETLLTAGERWPRSDLETILRVLSERMWPRAVPTAPGEVDAQYELLSGVADGLMLIDPSRSILFVARTIARAKATRRKDRLALQLLRESVYVGAINETGRRGAWRRIHEARRLSSFSPEHVAWERFSIANMELHRNPRRATSVALAAAGDTFAKLPDADGLWAANIGLIQGTCLRAMGDLPGLRTQEAWLAKMAEHRRDSALRTTTLLGGHIIWLADDAPEVSRHFLQTIPWPTRHDSFHFQHWLRAETEVETSLYEGDAEGGWARIAEARRPLLFCTLKTLQTVRMSCNFTYGRALLGLVEARTNRGGVLRWRDHAVLRLIIRWLDDEGSDSARVRAAYLRAGLAAVRRDDHAVRVELARAITIAAAAEYELYVALAQLTLGAMGDRVALRAAESALHRIGVVRPERFVAVEIPGVRRYFSLP